MLPFSTFSVNPLPTLHFIHVQYNIDDPDDIDMDQKLLINDFGKRRFQVSHPAMHLIRIKSNLF
ncbi:MAG TPA: hypothetical protein VND43_01035 [Burkholderiales bacterium]|nr:hypothetical protein [Burkholderiales bacterium]